VYQGDQHDFVEDYDVPQRHPRGEDHSLFVDLIEHAGRMSFCASRMMKSRG
jgi:hypothetical protein